MPQQLNKQPITDVEAELLGYPLTQGQINIVGATLDPNIKRLIISAYTQYGKTRAVSIGVLIDLINSPTTKKRVLIVAPSIKQTSIIRNYIAEHITTTPTLQNLVDKPRYRDPADLKNEMSRERLTFKNGWEILTLSAHGDKGEEDPGKQLMGYGGDIIILDEACLILDRIYRTRINRMLTSNPNAKLIILVNPWRKHHFAYKAWTNKRYTKIHVPWQQGVAEGRVTQEFIDEAREELTPIEFKVLYASEFPSENEDALIRWSWIEQASTNNLNLKNAESVWGLDVAEKGTDKTVLTHALTDGANYKIIEQYTLKTVETMDTANKVAALIPKSNRVNVDSIGVGAGVHSRLRELGYNAVSIRVSESPLTADGKRRFENQKSERYWQLRTLFEHGNISIPNESTLIGQLSQMGYEISGRGKIRIIDPPKSPDYADSLMLTIQNNQTKRRRYSGYAW